MLCGLMDACEADSYFDYDTSERVDFTDKGYFADWAKESIVRITSAPIGGNMAIMTGTGGGKFSPWFNYSREQAIATMVRINDIIGTDF